MNWSRAINSYCERTDPGFWSQPVNALTNAAFLVAAILCWRMVGARRDFGLALLCVVLAAIGVGSFLFHTYAQVWAMMADVLPILAFILIYIHLATVRFLGAPFWADLLAASTYVPFSAIAARGVEAAAGPMNGSVGYTPVVILLLGYAAIIRRGSPSTARGLAVAAVVLCLSLAFRTLDAGICAAFPLGTHFLWHLVNGALLGGLIVILARHDPGEVARAG